MKKQLLYSICLLFAISITKGQNNNQKSAAVVTRRTLLENYAGIKCGNCPLATNTAEQIEQLYGNDVVLLTIHAGFFATPNATYMADFRTQTGNDWDNFFGISAAGNPNGMVNRKDYSPNHVKQHSSWQTETSGFVGQPAAAAIIVNKNYNSVTRVLDLDVKTKFLQNSTANYKVMVVLAENGIVTAQSDYGFTGPNNMNPAYNYDHILRESLTGSWGFTLNSTPVLMNDSITKSITNFSVSPNFNDNNLDIIAFVYDVNTYEVIQVERDALNPIINSIKELNDGIRYVIYPNPSTDIISLKNNPSLTNYIITDQLGRIVLSGKLLPENTEIDIRDLANGFYTLTIGEKNQQSVKIIKK